MKKKKKIKLQYVRAENMLADFITKPITRKNMERFNNFKFSR